MPPLSLRNAQHVCCVELGNVDFDEVKNDGRLIDYANSTLYRWRQMYRETFCLPVDMSLQKQSLMGGKFRRQRTKLSRSVLEELETIYKKGPRSYLVEAQDAVYLRTGKKLSVKTISIALGEHLNRTRQVLFAKASQADEFERQEFLNHCALFHDPKVFIDVDETSRKVVEARKYAYMLRGGKDNNVSDIFDPTGQNSYTLIAAANINGFVPAACRMVQRSKDSDDLDPTHGTVDADAFLRYIKNDLLPVLGNYENCEPNSVVLMDNAPTHLDPEVRIVIEAAGAKLIYTPACSPDLIFIEYDFRMYKSYLRRHFREARENPMQVHLDALGCVAFEDQCRIFNHIGCFQNVPSFEKSKLLPKVATTVTSTVAAFLTNKRQKLR